MLFCQGLASLSFDNFVRAVTFVCNKYLGNIGAGMLVYLLQPVGDVVEGLLLGAVVHQNNAHSTLVVGLCDCPETLLASCVPNLQLDLLIININILNLEVNA